MTRPTPHIDRNRLAVFLATSGHSGVDRIMGNLLPAIAERGIRVDLLHVERHGPYLARSHPRLQVVNLGHAHAFSSLWALVRYLRTRRPFTLFSDKDRVNRVSLLARRLSGVPTRVVIRTGTTVSRDLESRGRWETLQHYLSMHHFYPMADAIVVPSQGVAEDLATFARLPIERIQVVPSPVVTPEIRRMSRENPDHPWLRPKTCPIILGVGELSVRKDFETLVRAFHKVAQTLPSKLIILGAGRRQKALERLIADLGLKDRAHLAGFNPNPYAFMVQADLYAHASHLEGLPVALIEALSFGLPAVATDCPSGPREILQDGRYGKLVPMRDPDAMAAAIIETLRRPPAPDFVREAVRPFLLQNSVDRYLAALGFTAF